MRVLPCACSHARAPMRVLPCACSHAHVLGTLRNGRRCRLPCCLSLPAQQQSTIPEMQPSSLRRLLACAAAEQKVKVSVTPMSTLVSILTAACGKLKPPLEPSACGLVIHEGRSARPVANLAITWRLAN
eukprot:99475-Chlamydomonas_euryale.AAC.1